ncbi:MAG: type II toxin-antitoxin system RelE/ParE family toxin [Sedimentisphaerales bacterium]|nr:type II toxin-antitoxin system RelE/ParE family toxin [Sedimentisphaerales bacterium]
MRFLQVAKRELDDAVEYYHRERPGLGHELLWEVFFAIDRIKQFPQAWQIFYEDARRRLIRRFPYGIVYICASDLILILAVAHLHREPDYWIDRLSGESDRNAGSP